MADKDNQLLIIAALDTSNASVNNIKEDLKKIADKLNKEQTFKITANLNDKTISNLQSQLNNISKNLNLNIGNVQINAGNVKSVFNGVIGEANKATNAVKSVSSSLTDVSKRFTNPIKIEPDTKGVINAQEAITKLENQLKGLGKSVSIKATFGDDVHKNISGMTAEIKGANDEVRTLNFRLNETKNQFNYVGGTFNNAGTNKYFENLSKQLERANAEAIKYQSTLNNIKADYSDKNAAKPINNTESLNLLNEQYNKITQSIEKLKTADNSTFATTKANIDSEIKALSQLVTQRRNLEYVATSLRTKDFATVKEAELQKFAEFETKVKSSSQVFSVMKSDLEGLRQQLNSAFNKESLTAYLNQLSVVDAKIKAVSQEFKNLKSVETNITNKIKSLNALGNNGVLVKNQSDAQVQATYQEIDRLRSSYEKLLNLIRGGNLSNSDLTKLQNEAVGLDAAFNNLTMKTTALQTTLKQDSGAVVLKNRYETLINTIDAYMDANNRAANATAKNGKTYAQIASEIKSDLQQALSSGSIDTRGLETARNQFARLRSEIKAVGKEGQTAFTRLWNGVKKFSNWMGITYVTASIAREIRGMFSDVVKLDDALVDLKKTFNGTSEDLDKFYTSANSVAKQLGVTTEEVINAASSWSRLGYSTAEQATEMAKLSSMFASISPGMDIDTATNGLVSIMKAFKVDVKDVKEDIMSTINELGNTRALSNSDIVTGLLRSSAAMAAMGNSFRETVALFVSAQEIVQNSSQVGNALRSITLRVRGLDEETEQLSADLVNVTGKAVDLTKTASNDFKGVSLFTDETQTEYKSIYDYLVEIADIRDELSEKNQQELLETLFGKHRANVGAAILENIEAAKDSMDIMANSFGSADKEMGIIEESISYKINALKETLVGIAQEGIGRDVLGNIIDSSTRLLNSISDVSSPLNGLLSTFNKLFDIATKLADKIGVIPTILAGITVKNLGVFKTLNSDIGNVTTKLAFFNKSLSDIGSDFKNYSGLGKFRAFFNVVTQDDINQFNSYVRAIQNGVDSNKAWTIYMSNASSSIRQQASEVTKLTNAHKANQISTENYIAKMNAATVQTESLSAAQKASVVTSGLLNAALNMGVTLAISFAITKMIELSQAEEKAAQKAEELRQKSVENAIAIEEENNSLTNLQKRYVELVTSTNNINNIKSDLLEIQSEINGKYKDEANQIDIVNGKYSEYLKTLRETKYEKADSYVTENYTKAKDATETKNFGVRDVVTPYRSFSGTTYGVFASGKEYKTLDFANGNLNFRAGTLDLQIDELKDYIDLERQYNLLSEKDLRILEDKLTSLKNLKKQVDQTTEAYQTQLDYKNNYEEWDKLSTNIKNQYSDLLDKTKEAITIINTSDSFSEKFKANENLIKYKDELSEMARKYPAVSDEINTLFNTIEESTNKVGTSLTDVSALFKSFRNDTLKSALSSVDDIKSAIQSTFEGEGLSFEDFWKIKDLDTDNIITNIKQINGMYYLSTNELIKLKDSLISKDKELVQTEIENAKKLIEAKKQEIEMEKHLVELEQSQLTFGKVNSPADLIYVNKHLDKIKEYETFIKDTETNISNLNFLLGTLNSNIGDTTTVTDKLKDSVSNLQDEVSKLEDYADELLKHEEKEVDNIIDKLEERKEVLESEKDELEEQLDLLEEQKSAIEDTIKNYESVASYVKDVISEEVKSIEEERDKVSDYYDDLIDKLKAQNEERQSAINLAEKQAALENVRNNKHRVYDEVRGYIYKADESDIAKAENDLLTAQNEKKINDLEEQREKALKPYEEQIKLLEEYSDTWQDVTDEVTKAEKDMLAQELLGSNWREKIKKKDLTVLNNFKNNYENYQSQLESLVNNEIKMLNDSITAKEKEIELQQKQIEGWKEYKDEFQNAVDSIKDKWSDYVLSLDNITLSENSSLEERQANLSNFVSNYKSLIDEISEKNAQIEEANNSLGNLSNTMSGFSVESGSFNLDSWLETIMQPFEKMMEMFERLFGNDSPFSIVLSNGNTNFPRFANGGISDKTGFAYMDGTKRSSEVVFNASQAKKLYNLVADTSDLTGLVANKIGYGLGSNYSTNNITNNNKPTNITNTFKFGNVVSNNPIDFKRQMEQYWRTEYNRSLVQ